LFAFTLPVFTVQLTSAKPVTYPVVINEVDCHGNDWIELFNTEKNDIDLSGWGLSDKNPSISSARHTYIFPARTLIKGKGYLVVQQSGLGSKQLKFGVACAGGESIWLSKPITPTSFDPISQIPIPPVAPGVTYGRIPNGTGAFQSTNPTKSRANISALPKLLGEKVRVCAAGKTCVIHIRATNAGVFKILKPVKGISLTSKSTLKFSSHNRGQYVLWLKVTNSVGVQKTKLTISVK
jgi:hypothetical protein